MDSINNNNENSSLEFEKNKSEELNLEEQKAKELELKQQKLKTKKFLMGVFYAIFLLIIVWLSIIFSFTQNVWFMERFFGMVSYFLFFLTVAVGIIRKFGPKFRWSIRYHKPAAIWAFMFLLGHVIAVIFDNFKWGYQLTPLTYFGLDFSSKWLWPTSIGAIALWIFVIVTMSSIGKNMRRLGVKTWKKIHYLSYIGFALISVHAFLLGTDFKYMSYSGALVGLAIILNALIFVLLIIRLVKVFIVTRKV